MCPLKSSQRAVLLWWLAAFAFARFCTAVEPAPAEPAWLIELLDETAPPPDWREHLRHRPPLDPRPRPRAVTLISKWRTVVEMEGTRPTPTSEQAAALVEDCEKDPQLLPLVVDWIPADDAARVRRLRLLHDRILPDTEEHRDARNALHNWLVTRTAEFLDELRVLAKKDFPPDGLQWTSEAFRGLMKSDWPAAEAILLQKATGADETPRTVALALLFEHDNAITAPRAGEWLDGLKTIAEDPAATASARNGAIEGLMQSPWPGQEPYFLGLFQDATLQELTHNSTVYSPLAAVVRDDPKRWIPHLTRLVPSKERAVHDNAVRCLAEFHLERANADALRPLLPWLGDPKWSDAGELLRLRVAQSMDRVNMPECIPGLLWIAEHENGFLLSAAAEGLAHHKAKDAVPVLRRAIGREEDSYHRRTVNEAVHDLGGFSVSDKVQAIESFARRTATEESEREFRMGMKIDPAPTASESIGEFIGRNESMDDMTAQRVLERADALQNAEPAIAVRLRGIATGWDSPPVMNFVIARLARGELPVRWVLQLLAKPARFKDAARRADGTIGFARGLRAALMADDAEAAAVSDSHDRNARLALLACARLSRTRLPVPKIAAMLDDKDHALAIAAEFYLESDDSPEARAELLRRHPGEALILGAAWGFHRQVCHDGRSNGPDRQMQIAMELRKPGGPREIYALLSLGGFGDDGQRYLVVDKDRVTLRHSQGQGRWRERRIDPGEFAAFAKWIAGNQIEDLPPYDAGVADGIVYTFIHATRDGGRRVEMNNPVGVANGFTRVEFGGQAPGPDARIYGGVVQQFLDLEKKKMELRYGDASKSSPASIVWARENGTVSQLCEDGGRPLIEIKRDDDSGERTSEWHRIEDGAVNPKPAPAPRHAKSELMKLVPKGAQVSEWLVKPSDSSIGDGFVCPMRRDGEAEALWLLTPEKAPEQLLSGVFAYPVTSGDGQWIVAARAPEGGWAAPNVIVRIHVPTRAEHPVNIPAAHSLDPVCWLPAHQRVLVLRGADSPTGDTRKPDSPREPEFSLLNPADGTATRVTGDFAPFTSHSTLGPSSERPLQATGRADEVWAARQAKGGTEIGRYNLKAFKFAAVWKVDGLSFGSDSVWVDERASVAWIAINGDLLRWPLKP